MRKSTRRPNRMLNVNIFKFLSLFLMFIFLVSLPLFIQGLIKIKKVECISQYGLCPDVTKDLLNQAAGKNLKVSKEFITKYLDQNILVNSYLIQYKIPNTLKVELNLKKAVYSIRGLDNTIFVVDKQGLILDKVKDTNLPQINDPTFTESVGNNIPDSYLFGLKIIEKVSWLYSVKTGNIENGTLVIFLKDGVSVNFPLEGDVDVLVGSLRLVFSRLNDGSQGIKMSDIKEIDLRYKSVVLR